jgi:hypothetical protein
MKDEFRMNVGPLKSLALLLTLGFLTLPPFAHAARHSRSRRAAPKSSGAVKRVPHTHHGPYHLEKFEPATGCYLGAYAEADDRLGGVRTANGHWMTREEGMGAVIGKPLATAFTYSHYGERFPSNWAQNCVRAGIAPQIALEPNNGLYEVNDDSYLQQYARDAAACGGPVFLRFACEMNGVWTNFTTIRRCTAPSSGWYTTSWRGLLQTLR